jgi:uncharacterized phage protein gp47/JayE
MATQTQTQLTQLGYDQWKSADPNAQPDIEGTDSYFKLNSTAAMGTMVAQDSQLVENNIFPVSATVPYIDKHAAELGMTPRMGALPTTGTVYLYGTPSDSFIPDGDYTIPADTVLESSLSGVSYITLTDVVLLNGIEYEFNSSGYLTVASSGSLVEVNIQSINTGTSTVSSPSSQITFDSQLSIPTSTDPYIITDAAIPDTGLTPGSNTESDQLLAIRIYDWIQNPHGGGSSGDYIKWGFLALSRITGIEVVDASVSTSAILYPVALEGNADKNYFIDGDVYNDFAQSPNNRSVNSTDIATVQTYINSQVPVNSSPLVISADTYYVIYDDNGDDNLNMNLDQSIAITVSLAYGFNLSSNVTITNADGTTQQLTAKNLILRELRRGIVTTPYEGNPVYYGEDLLGNYIKVDDLQRIIMEGLSATDNFTGNYASLITGITIVYTKGVTTSDYIEVPDLQNNNKLIFDSKGYLVYDIDVDSNAITIAQYT